MKTFTAKIDPANRKWWLVDLQGVTLGRAAVKIANILRGKNKPIFSPHLDTGDDVVAINASGLNLTGRKLEQKKYYRYSGYPGGLGVTGVATMLEKHPDRVFNLAVKGMLPKNKLGRKQLKKLHIYGGPDHPHKAQKPQELKLS